MLKDIMTQNANNAKQKLQEEIRAQKAFIKLKEEMFYNSLISNPNNYSIREQATFLASCRGTLDELELALFTLEKEFPSLPSYEELAAEFADLDSCNWEDEML
jgi:hypothetical protein